MSDPAAPDDSHPYRGRFAPSPTGRLHFGSLVAAAGSFLQARARRGEWLVRIEDLDSPRNQPGAADAILHELERLGLHWDGAVVRQSERVDRYRAALDVLDAGGWTFACACTRRDVAGAVYPGTCRGGLPPGRRGRSVRMRVGDAEVAVDDGVQGPYRQHLGEEVGDFVVLRADGIVAYHLSVALDDAEQGMTQVVRGADLLESTPRQIHVLRCLGHAAPAYAHLPVATNRLGQKLSKQTHAAPIEGRDAGQLLWSVLDFLGQRPPPEMRAAPGPEVVAWGVAHWDLARVGRAAAYAPGG